MDAVAASAVSVIPPHGQRLRRGNFDDRGKHGSGFGARIPLMVLTKEELIQTLQHEVRIFVHLLSKVDRDKLDYRPTGKQRSTMELIRYMTYMAPVLVKSIRGGAFDMPAWSAASAAAEGMDLDAATAAISAQS